MSTKFNDGKTFQQTFSQDQDLREKKGNQPSKPQRDPNKREK